METFKLLKTRRLCLYIFIGILFNHITIQSKAWKILFYIDSSSDLSDMAIKNITDALKGQSSDQIDMLVQLHAYNKTGLRFKISGKNLEFIEEVALLANSKENLKDSLNWAFSETNGAKTMLILAGHGWGILDPIWNFKETKWELPAINKSYCNLGSRGARGLLSESQFPSFIKTSDLFQSLKDLSSALLDKGKLDLLALDICMGAMLEIAYGTEKYVKNLVGVQRCSKKDGMDFKAIIEAANKNLEPAQLSKEIVKACDNYYSIMDESKFYTYSALDLAHTREVSLELDRVIKILRQNQELLPRLKQAGLRAKRSCIFPMYADPVAILNDLATELSSEETSEKIQTLFCAIEKLIYVTQKFVIAHCTGEKLRGHAHGYAIYWPKNFIEPEYYNCEFAQQSGWPELLKLIVALA